MPGTLARTTPCQPLALRMTPAHAVARWPADIPAAWLTSHTTGPGTRWSILGIPSGPVERRDPLRALGVPARPAMRDPDRPPFTGGWIGWIGYEFGERIEPSVGARAHAPRDDRGWPACNLLRCDSALVYDAHARRWWGVGDTEVYTPIARAIANGTEHAAPFRVGALRSATGRGAFERDTQRVIDLIHAGDAFQVNLAHRLSAPFEGSPRALHRRLIASAEPMFGALIEDHDEHGIIRGAVCSASPELFLRLDAASGRVVTRPMKGTRARRDGAEALRTSEKDGAELAMIVDLMRNDLGRVCEFGSVRVDEARRIEAHHGVRGGVWQGVASVSGVPREGVTHADLMRAAFPPGSVTGAPKVRAMQIIRGLEPVARGPYCGAIGWVSDSGDACWSVAIRTGAIRLDETGGGRIDYAVGAGIVADSDPRAEWRETLAKASAFRHAVRAGGDA